MPLRTLRKWMGHADVQTTVIHLHYAPRGDAARVVTDALGLGAVVASPEQVEQGSEAA